MRLAGSLLGDVFVDDFVGFLGKIRWVSKYQDSNFETLIGGNQNISLECI